MYCIVINKLKLILLVTIINVSKSFAQTATKHDLNTFKNTKWVYEWNFGGFDSLIIDKNLKFRDYGAEIDASGGGYVKIKGDTLVTQYEYEDDWHKYGNRPERILSNRILYYRIAPYGLWYIGGDDFKATPMLLFKKVQK